MPWRRSSTVAVEQPCAEFRRVEQFARALRHRAHEQIRRDFDRLAATAPTEAFVADGGTDHQTGHWYRFDVIRAAREAGSYANFAEDHYFVKASIRVDGERLVFVVSFHHAGQELTGMMEAIAFAHLESYAEAEDRELPTRQFAPCSVDPFVFTYRTEEEDIAALFRQWLDAAMAAALKQFADLL